MLRTLTSEASQGPLLKQKTSNLINIIAGVLLIVTGTFLIALFKQPQYATRYTLIIILTAVACTTLIYFARQGYVNWSAGAFVSFLLLMIFTFSWTGGGIKGHGMKILPIVVLFAGLTLGRKHIFTFGLIAIICALGLVLAGHFKLLTVTGPLGDSPMIHWIYTTTSILLMCLLEYLSIGGLDKALLEAREELELRKRSEEKYRLIFESFQDVYYQSDLEGRIMNISPSIKKRAGYEPQEIIGKNVVDFYSDQNNREAFIQQLKQDGSVQNYELDTVSKTGEIIHNLVSSHVLYDEQGKPKWIEGTLHDITLRKKAENHLKVQNEKLIEIAFLQSHMVRRPVANVLGLISLINPDKPDDPINFEVIPKLEIASRELDTVIHQVLRNTEEINTNLKRDEPK